MDELTASDFSQFFRELWGKAPFAWQQALAEQVLAKEAIDQWEDAWPDALALPTASGKTACLDIAVFTLATQALRLRRRQNITAPRRIFFVVDRRVIVDQAYERARCIAHCLQESQDGILKEVADRLRLIAHGEWPYSENVHPDRETLPLASYSLRGGMYRSEAWAHSPLQPAIVASTVDQIGSRLLFRAYGRSYHSWPIYAGLIANDSLIFLDEAHCAQPFLQTLQSVQRYRQWADNPLNRSFRCVVMSATPPPGLNTFEDPSNENRNPDHPLGRRQLAHKPTTLRIVQKAKGKKAIAELAKTLANTAVDLVSDQRKAVVAFANRVATARETYKMILEGQKDIKAILLTGRMRALDKDAVVNDHLKHLQSERREAPTQPLIVVATQTLEVGADLDFDGLVTECASLDALRQRFGRLNRMGRPIHCRASILIRKDQAEKGIDPIYGSALLETWNWLNNHKDKDGKIDFGIARMNALLKDDNDAERLNSPTSDAPIMLPAHCDLWAQTAPEPQPTPDVSIFLHGAQKHTADIQVCWRADLDLAKADQAIEALLLCPPSSVETLPVPIGIFKQWLTGGHAIDQSGDVEGEETIENETETVQTDIAEHRVLRWRGSDTTASDITFEPNDIRPGDVIVIPTAHPGAFEQIGDLPPDALDSVALLDIGDRAYRLARATPILRLHPTLVDVWPNCIKQKALALLEHIEQKFDEDSSTLNLALDELLSAIVAVSSLLLDQWSWLAKTANDLGKSSQGYRLHIVGAGAILIGLNRMGNLDISVDTFSDESDMTASGISHPNKKPVKLRNHLLGVKTFARRYAIGCGLSEELVDAVSRAGLLHDLGKADPRFQALLYGGVPWHIGEPLAKSSLMPKTQRRAQILSEYPKGGRHELLSVRLAQSEPALLPEKGYLRDLVLYLIASHHGRCRPFAPVVSDDQYVKTEFNLDNYRMHWGGPTNLERLDAGMADRYWQLTRRYGWWGLAWLEALLRLSDWRRSEWEESHNDEE